MSDEGARLAVSPISNVGSETRASRPPQASEPELKPPSHTARHTLT